LPDGEVRWYDNEAYKYRSATGKPEEMPQKNMEFLHIHHFYNENGLEVILSFQLFDEIMVQSNKKHFIFSITFLHLHLK